MMKSLGILLLLVAPSFGFAQTAPFFTYEGILTDTGGNPVTTSQVVTFQIIYGSTCVVFEETQNVTPGASGEFSAIVGAGSRSDSTGNTSDKIFSSSGSVNCNGSAPQSVSGFATRKLHIKVGGVDLSPDVTISYVPVAMNAQRLADKQATDFVQVNAGSGVTQTNVESIFSRYSTLNNMLNGTYTGLTASDVSDFSSAVAANETDPLVSGIANCAAGQVLTKTGGALTCVTDSSGTYTLPAATTTTLGGVKTGTEATTGIAVAGDGTISVSNTLTTNVSSNQTNIASLQTNKVDKSSMAVCGTNQVLIWQSPGDNFLCSNIALTASQVTDFTSSVDARVAADTTKLPKAGGTMTGTLTMSGAGTDLNMGNNLITNVGFFHLQNKTADPAFNAANNGYVWYNSSDGKIKYNDGTAIRELSTSGGAVGTVTSVSSANSDISVAAGTTTPVLTLNSGTGANQIVKLDGTGKLPPVDGSALTNTSVSVTNITGGASKYLTYAPNGVACANGEILKKTSLGWECAIDAGSVGSDAASLQGWSVSSMPPSLNQFLQYNGSEWEPWQLPLCGPGNTLEVDSMGAITCSVVQLPSVTTGTTAAKITYNNQGLVTASSALTATDIPALDASKITTGQLSDARILDVAVSKITSGSGKFFSYAPNGAVCSDGEVLKWDGTNTRWICGTDNSGGTPTDAGYSSANKGIVAFNTDAATSGINISAGVASVNTGTAANQIVKLDGSGRLPAVDGSALTNTSVSVVNITSGTSKYFNYSPNGVACATGEILSKTINGWECATNMSPFSVLRSGDSMTGNLIMSMGTSVMLGDDDSSNFISLRAPSSLPSNSTLTLPMGSGAPNQVMMTDGTGTLSWTNLPAGADNLGDHTATNNLKLNSFWLSGDGDSEGIYVNTAGNVGIGTNTPAFPLSVRGAIVMTGSTSGYTGFQAAPAAGSSIWTLPATDGANGQILKTNGAGVLSWFTPMTSVNSAAIVDGSILNSDINAFAAIDRSKLASGAVSHVLINDASGMMTSEAQLAVSRGGTGTNGFAANGLVMSDGTGTGPLAALTCASLGRTIEWTGSTWGCSADLVTTGTSGSKTNFVRVQGSSSGTPVMISASGSDIDVNLRLAAKGNGTVEIQSPVQVMSETVSRSYATISAYPNSGMSIDFSQGNLQYTTASCGAFNLIGLKDGATYTLAVQGTASGPCSFTGSGKTFRMPPDHGASEAGKHTLYNFIVMGNTVYVSWVTGY